MNGQKVQKSNLHFWLHIQRLFSCSAVRFSCSADLFSCSAMGFNPYPPKSSQDSCARTCNIIVMVPLLLCQGSENVSTPSPPLSSLKVLKTQLTRTNYATKMHLFVHVVRFHSAGFAIVGLKSMIWLAFMKCDTSVVVVLFGIDYISNSR